MVSLRLSAKANPELGRGLLMVGLSGPDMLGICEATWRPVLTVVTACRTATTEERCSTGYLKKLINSPILLFSKTNLLFTKNTNLVVVVVVVIVVIVVVRLYRSGIYEMKAKVENKESPADGIDCIDQRFLFSAR